MPRTMTWPEIENDWGRLRKRHRMEIAEAVGRYCIGHQMAEVGERLGYSKTWVITQLVYDGVCAAVREKGTQSIPLTGSTDNVAKELPRLIQEFGPSITADIGRGGESVNIQGDDAEAFQTYVDRYAQEGHEPAAAVRLAKAEWAGEAALDAGVIKEDVNKLNEKVNRILFPDDAKNTFALDLEMHIARVKSAARFLDTAKINHLQYGATCERVAEANERWTEQVDRVLNLHPNR